MTDRPPRPPARPCQPKYLGRDCELSTTGLDPGKQTIGSFAVTREVLQHVDTACRDLGHRAWSQAARAGTEAAWHLDRGGDGYGAADSSDCLRHWTGNGQCYYSDMGHVEVCTAECRTPFEFAAQSWGTLRLVEAARAAAQAAAAPGTRYLLAASNVDVNDPAISWGTHVNVAVTEELFENLLVDTARPGVFGFVTSILAAAVPFFGAGYLLPMRAGDVVFSLGARAHHLTRMTTDATTVAYERGLLNRRREPHARGMQRLHLIAFDFNLVSAALLAAFLQASLAAAEVGFGGLVLQQPLAALHAWSVGLDRHSGALTGRAELVDGRWLTLGAYLGEVVAALRRFLGRDLEVVAPHSDDLLARVVELAELADRGEVTRCARHLDWAAKLVFLLRACERSGSAMGAARARLLDHDFANTDPARSPLLRLWQHGEVDPLIDEAAIAASLRDGPPPSRGYGRGRLVRRFAADITSIDWDHVELALTDARFGPRLRIDLSDPGSFGREGGAALIERAGDVADLAASIERDGSDRPTFRDPTHDLRGELHEPTPRAPRSKGPP